MKMLITICAGIWSTALLVCIANTNSLIEGCFCLGMIFYLIKTIEELKG